ncbi:MAG: hypothetical protein ABI467_04535 [Kofleriaceae bacterium]
MNKIVLILVLLCGLASADGSGSGSAVAPAAPPGATAAQVAALEQTCADAMNADPNFAKSIELTINKQLDQQTIDAHVDALHHIQKNENHVIYAYAAMWVIAALLLVFLFLRQQALKTEIAALKRDLSRAEDKA